MMAFLRVLVNPDDDNAFLRIVNVPRREIGPTTLEKLGNYANMRQISMFAASFELGLEQHLTGRGLVHVQRFTRWLVETGDHAERGDTPAVLRAMIREINYEDWLYDTSPSPKAAEMRMKNVTQLFSWVTQMLEGDDENDSMLLPEIVIRLTLREMMERGEDEDDADQVQLMTLHASKGLEFPYVFLIGMEEGLLPSPLLSLCKTTIPSIPSIPLKRPCRVFLDSLVSIPSVPKCRDPSLSATPV